MCRAQEVRERTPVGVVTEFHRNFTVVKDPEELYVGMLKEATGQVRGCEVVNHLPSDPDDYDVQQYAWEG